jgi:glutathione reductase (NADPH)
MVAVIAVHNLSEPCTDVVNRLVHSEAQLGLVAVVESKPFGGTCALRGCDPKKVLVGAAEVVDWARRMKGKGIEVEKLQIDWPELVRFKRSFTEPVPQRREEGFAKAGIVAFHGRARFLDRTTLRVGEETLEGRHVVIATGRYH